MESSKSWCCRNWNKLRFGIVLDSLSPFLIDDIFDYSTLIWFLDCFGSTSGDCSSFSRDRHKLGWKVQLYPVDLLTTFPLNLKNEVTVPRLATSGSQVVEAETKTGKWPVMIRSPQCNLCAHPRKKGSILACEGDGRPNQSRVSTVLSFLLCFFF